MYIRNCARLINRKLTKTQNYYLVDFENSGSSGIVNVGNINKGDVFVVFYSDNTKNIALETIEYVTRRNAHIKSIKVDVGTKDALDFQLSSYLGYLIRGNIYSNYFIISNDKGYDCICSYWGKKGVKVQRLTTGTSVIKEKKRSKKKKKNKKVEWKVTADELRTYLNSEDDLEMLLSIINVCKSKSEINIMLSKRYRDSQKTSEVYNKIKPLINKVMG